jgi:hypothetical protein
MKQIRIDVAGWEAFNGFLGTVEFENGISVSEVTEMDIRRIGANIRIVEVESNEQIGPSTTIVNSRHVSAQLEVALRTEQEEQEDQDTTEKKYTEESLTQMADHGGIKAIRTIAAEYGIRGVSIQELIKEILEAQDKAD